MDYSGLLTRLATRLNRSDLTAEIPGFITSAEDVMFSRLAAEPVRPMATVLTQDIAEQSFALPADFIDVISFSAADDESSWQLLRLDPSDPTDWYATRSLPYRTEYDSSRVRHYSIIGSSLFFADELPETLSTTLIYYAKPPAISADSLTNWIIEKHPLTYELGALAMAYNHLRDDAAAAAKTTEFLGAIDLMIAAYPEKQNPGELRASDAPWASQRWNIANG